MTNAAFEYWRPGKEERQLRVFFSHRYGGDEALYDKVIQELIRNGFPVQDTSLSASQILKGRRGGKLSKLQIQAEIAARIFTSDVVIAPSRPAVTRSEWVTWEVQLAAVGYGVPVLFVNQRNNQSYATALVKQINAMNLPFRTCNPETSDISRSVAELVNPRPSWGVRQDEAEEAFRFRGPPRSTLEDVLRRVPYRPRLDHLDQPPPPSKRSLWPRFSFRQ